MRRGLACYYDDGDEDLLSLSLSLCVAVIVRESDAYILLTKLSLYLRVAAFNRYRGP